MAGDIIINDDNITKGQTVAFLDYPTIKEFWTPLPVMKSNPRSKNSPIKPCVSR